MDLSNVAVKNDTQDGRWDSLGELCDGMAQKDLKCDCYQ